MTRQRKTYRDAHKRVTGHQLYQKMSLLELEKTRRQKELAALDQRVAILRDILQDLEDELTTARTKIAAHLQETVQQKDDQRPPASRGHGTHSVFNTPQQPDTSEHFDVGRFLK